MKVILSVIGKFHFFDLARELFKRGHLERLITSYPKFETAKYGIPNTKVKSILIKELLQRSWNYLPASLKSLWNPQYAIHELYDRLAVGGLSEADILFCGASCALHTFRAAEKYRPITVLDRGSSHIVYQTEILKEEYEQLGIPILPFQIAHPKIIEKEMLEYEVADYISVPSSYVKRTFIERGIPEQKIIQVPYGVDLSAFRQIPKIDNVFRVVFVGGMSIRKGVHYLLQAFAELKLPNAELVLIGTMNDEMKPFFKRYAGSYKYIGHVPQGELYTHYSQGSVFCIASIEEGLALVQLQAMACGLPIIATINTGGEDIIREGKDGFIVPIRDVRALKQKLVYLYEHEPERVRMGESAKERVATGFSWNDYGEKMVAAFQKMIQAKKQ